VAKNSGSKLRLKERHRIYKNFKAVYVLTKILLLGDIFAFLRSLGIDSKESILPAYASLAGQYDNPITFRFLAPIDCSKIPALEPLTVYSSVAGGAL
jgi:hypothetical protein